MLIHDVIFYKFASVPENLFFIINGQTAVTYLSIFCTFCGTLWSKFERTLEQCKRPHMNQCLSVNLLC